MKLKSISGVVYNVSDLQKTAAFYEKLGFRPGKQENNSVTVYVNWFWVEFHAQNADKKINQSAGNFLCVSVDSVDDLDAALRDKGIKPVSTPVAAFGRKELTVIDPDGHKLIFFEKA